MLRSARVEPQEVTWHEIHASLVRASGQLLGLVDGQGDRLLDEDVDVSLKERKSRREPIGFVVDDADGVEGRRRRHGCRRVVVLSDPVESGNSLRVCTVDVADGDYINSWDSEPGANVLHAPRTQPDDADAKRGCAHVSP